MALSLALLSTLASAQTLVTVNGTAITQQDVDKELMAATQGRFNQVPQEKQSEFRKQVLEQVGGDGADIWRCKSKGIFRHKRV